MNEDAEALFPIRADDRVNEYLDRPKALSVEDAKKFITIINNNIAKDEVVYWAIILKDEQKLAGTICLWNISVERNSAEIGFELHPDYQNRGIMQEAMSSVLRYGFDHMKLSLIEGFVHVGNARSLHLLTKNDFTPDPEMESKRKENPDLKDMVIYTRAK